MLEVTDARQARAGAEIGLDGFIVKGHESGGWIGEETAFVLLQRILSRPRPASDMGARRLVSTGGLRCRGGCGVVLDSQLSDEESSVGEAAQKPSRPWMGARLRRRRRASALFRLFSRSGARGIDRCGSRDAMDSASGSRGSPRPALLRGRGAVGWAPSDSGPRSRCFRRAPPGVRDGGGGASGDSGIGRRHLRARQARSPGRREPLAAPIAPAIPSSRTDDPSE
jgi:hypothetical protein